MDPVTEASPPQTGCWVITGEYKQTQVVRYKQSDQFFSFSSQIDAQKHHDSSKLPGKRLLNLNFVDLWRDISFCRRPADRKLACVMEVKQTQHVSRLIREALIVKQQTGSAHFAAALGQSPRIP